MEYAAMWIAFAVICYALAKKKGKDEFIALGMGIIFGLFALLYYLFCKGSKEYEVKKAEKRLELEKVRME